MATNGLAPGFTGNLTSTAPKEDFGSILGGLAGGLEAVTAGFAKNPQVREQFAGLVQQRRAQTEQRQQQRIQSLMAVFDQMTELAKADPRIVQSQGFQQAVMTNADLLTKEGFAEAGSLAQTILSIQPVQPEP